MLDKIKEMDIVSKMSVIGAIIVLLIILVVVVVSCSNTEPPAEIPSTSNRVTDEVDKVVDPIEDKEFARIIGVVSGIDTASGTVFITNVETSEKVVLTLPQNMVIQDAYGSQIALNQVYVGELVESKYDIETNVPETFKISNQGFERKNVKNLVVNEETMTIQLFNDTYGYNEHLVIFFGDEPVPLSEIDPADEVVVRGFKETIWSITLENKHGYLVLENTASFIGGIVEVNKNYVTITENTEITVPVGIHSVIITKDDMDPYVTEAIIQEDETFVIDLGQLKTEIGAVLFSIVQEGAVLYVDNERIDDLSTPVNLTYGTHAILVENDNYLPWTTDINVSAPYQDYEIDLDAQDLMIQVDEPIETEILIDGVLIGEIPIKSPISQGNHILTLQKEGYYSKTYNISIDSEEGIFEFNFPELVEDPNYVGDMIEIKIDNPVGAELYVDSAFIGTIPATAEVAAGSHQLTIRKDGFYAKLYTIDVALESGPYQYTFPDLVEIGVEEEEEETDETDTTEDPEDNTDPETPADDNYTP